MSSWCEHNKAPRSCEICSLRVEVADLKKELAANHVRRLDVAEARHALVGEQMRADHAEAEVKRLRAIIDHSAPIEHMTEQEVRAVAGFQRDLRQVLYDENRRLREALERIYQADGDLDPNYQAEIARVALKGEK